MFGKALSVEVSEVSIACLFGFLEIASASPGFFLEEDRAYDHCTIQRLGHVVDGQSRHAGPCKCFHLYTGFPRTLDRHSPFENLLRDPLMLDTDRIDRQGVAK